jgi:uncharacterized protein DUF222/HNH endonuclease
MRLGPNGRQGDISVLAPPLGENCPPLRRGRATSSLSAIREFITPDEQQAVATFFAWRGSPTRRSAAGAQRSSFPTDSVGCYTLSVAWRLMAFEALTKAIDELAEADPTTLADAEAIELLHRNFTRLDAVLTKASAAFDASGNWRPSGAPSAAHYIAYRCNAAIESSKRRMRLGRALRHMPATDAAWTAGQISADHARAMAAARTGATEEAFARDEEQIVGWARSRTLGGFYRDLKWWSYRQDPDGAEDDAEVKKAKRKVHLSQSWQDLWFGDLTLDPIAGTVVSNELKRLEKIEFDIDWAEAKARLGTEYISGSDLRRTPAQRRADALVEMATRSGAMPPGARKPEPLFTVLVGWETFAGPICNLASGHFVTPGSLVEWLPKAWLERVVFSSPSRVIDVGTSRRLFEGATRKAVLTRDQQCFHEYCDTPAEECQADHIIPWAMGGPTEQANGRAACGFHNRQRHRRRRL